MKNRIYTIILFGISIAFSTVGQTQTKPVNKHISPKTATATTPHSKTTKPNPTSSTKSNAKITDKKKPISTKPAIKNTPSAKTNKLTVSNKPAITVKSAKKKPIIASAKSKKNKQDLPSSKSKQKKHATADSDTRRHSVISSKAIESVTVKQVNHKKPHESTPTNLDRDLYVTESEQSIPTNNDKTFRPLLTTHPQTTKINTAHVSIETSLFLDGLEADLSKELILQLTDIFAWDIDFATNLRPGDQFTVVYGKKLIDGKATDTDEIIAAEFINQGKPHTAVRYLNEFGIASYYTPSGESMQRAFLSTPVDFAKISSPFDMHRMHPILNRIRAHKGIDYAARIGTPVKTTGDGVVSFSGNKGAYGQVIIIQHNDHYETLYAHMSDFKKGLTVGNHVKQGDVIGYVGQSGLATGPHLHYEFHVDGLYRDPESVKIPHSMPISNLLLADFNAQTQPFYTQLNQVKAKSLIAKTHSTQRYAAPDVAQPPAAAQPPHYDYD